MNQERVETSPDASGTIGRLVKGRVRASFGLLRFGASAVSGAARDSDPPGAKCIIAFLVVTRRWPARPNYIQAQTQLIWKRGDFPDLGLTSQCSAE